MCRWLSSRFSARRALATPHGDDLGQALCARAPVSLLAAAVKQGTQGAGIFAVKGAHPFHGPDLVAAHRQKVHPPKGDGQLAIGLYPVDVAQAMRGLFFGFFHGRCGGQNGAGLAVDLHHGEQDGVGAHRFQHPVAGHRAVLFRGHQSHLEPLLL